MPKEQLSDCPHCARKAFTAAGLKAHLAQKHRDLPRQAAQQSGPKAAAPGKVSKKKEPLTLAKLDVLPPVTSVAIKDMTVPQLGEAFAGLDRVEQSCEKLSGVVATLKGLVLLEVKRKLKHGEFIPWVKNNFPKSHDAANRYMRIGSEFAKFRSSAEFDNSPAFALLSNDLSTSLTVLERQKLDVSNPIVGQVIKWTEGKSAYQLLLELGGGQGGDHRNPDAARPTLAELREQAISNFRSETFAAFDCVDKVGDKFKLLKDAEIELTIHTAEAYIREAKRWLKIPQKDRTRIDAGKLLGITDEEE